jgi:uncharacterized protein YeeX (DUF496 family)
MFGENGGHNHNHQVERRLDNVERKLSEVQSTLDLVVNYLQVIAQQLGLQERTHHIAEQLEVTREMGKAAGLNGDHVDDVDDEGDGPVTDKSPAFDPPV